MRDRRRCEPSLSSRSPTTAPGGPTLPHAGNRREGYATPTPPLKREPSALLAQAAQHHDVHAAPALQIAGDHDALLGEPEPRRERPGGGVVGRRGDLHAVEAERLE